MIFKAIPKFGNYVFLKLKKMVKQGDMTNLT